MAFVIDDTTLLGRTALAVRTLLNQGKADEAREASAALDEFCPLTVEESRLAASLLLEVSRTGWAEIAINRYLKVAPNDQCASLDLIELKLNVGAPVTDLLLSIKVDNLEQLLRTAHLFSRAGQRADAIQRYRNALSQDRLNVAAHRGLIENLIQEGSKRAARKATRELMRVAPDEAAWWALVAIFSAQLGDMACFNTATIKVQNMLTARDDYSRLLITTAYSLRGDIREVDRLLNGWQVGEASSDWIVSEMLKLSVTNGLPHHQITIARRLVEIKGARSNEIQRAERIISNYNAHGEPGLWQEKFM